MLFAGLFQRVDNNAQSLDTRILFVIGLQNVPGGKCRVGLLEHLVGGFLVEIPLFAVAPVFVCDLPLLLRRILAVCETGELGGIVDLYPEFDDDGTPFGQFFLKFIDLVIGALPVVFGAESLETFYHDTAVPGAVEDRDVAVLGKACPEAPEEMPGLFVRLGACNRKHLESSGIQSCSDTLDIAALAGSIPSLVGNDDRDFPAVQLVVQGMELFLQTVQFFLVLLIRYYLVGKCDFGQERCAVERERVLPDRRCEGMILESSFDSLIQEAQYLQLGPLAVLGVNDVPGSRRAVRILRRYLSYMSRYSS